MAALQFRENQSSSNRCLQFEELIARVCPLGESGITTVSNNDKGEIKDCTLSLINNKTMLSFLFKIGVELMKNFVHLLLTPSVEMFAFRLFHQPSSYCT